MYLLTVFELSSWFNRVIKAMANVTYVTFIGEC